MGKSLAAQTDGSRRASLTASRNCAAPWLPSIAKCSHMYASTQSCGTTCPFAYIIPSVPWALATPYSVAFAKRCMSILTTKLRWYRRQY